MTESGQLSLLDVLSERLNSADAAVNDMLDPLNPAIEANPNDNLMLEMYGYITDARAAIEGIRRVMTTMQERDRSELP